MNPIDRAILQHCENDFRPITPLKEHVSAGTLYRHVSRLVRLGWLEKAGTLYRTTATGARQLAEGASQREWDGLAKFYPPLDSVPTAVHRAVIELVFAAVAARQAECRPDRHPYFAIFGKTMRWKSSLGQFVCYALGLDPALHVVDCGAETGKSLSFRRGSDGALVSKRDLLEAPFVTLDEFLNADPTVRATLGVFLGGKLVVPVENEKLTIHPVALLTLNPRDKETLEEQVGLSAPLIRRGLLANLDAVAMPDLAQAGEAAVEAAKNHPPIPLGRPAGDVQRYRAQIIHLARAILTPEAQDRVDVEILVTLSTGMTAFLPEPADAIAQVGRGLGLLAETLGWTRPGWIEAVAAFTLDPARGSQRRQEAGGGPVGPISPATRGTAEAEGAPPASIPLSSLPTAAPRPPAVPDLEISPELRGRLIWFAVDTGLPVDEALATLLDYYVRMRDNEGTIQALVEILNLGRELERTEIEITTLQEHLKACQALAAEGCTFEDVPEALKLITVLQALPVPWSWRQARQAMEVVAVILEKGLRLPDLLAAIKPGAARKRSRRRPRLRQQALRPRNEPDHRADDGSAGHGEPPIENPAPPA
jgi:hypothetical protein